MFDDESLLPDALRADRRAFVVDDIYAVPDWYDVDYAAYRGEVAFYRRVLERHAGRGTVVELGAGTGRLAVPFAQEGHRLHAVEPADAMRATLRAKRDAAGLSEHLLVIEAASAHDFVGPRDDVAVVYFAFNGLLHLTSAEALHDAFRHVHARLASGGVFALDITGPYWESMLRGAAPWGRVDERVHPRNGRHFLTCDRSRYESDSRTMAIDIRYAWLDDLHAPGVQTRLRQHMWTYPEILAALTGSGFHLEERFGDVDLSPFDAGSPRLLVTARRR